MSATVMAVVKEIAPVLRQLVEREVDRAVTRALAQDTRGAWRGRWREGIVYDAAALVEHDGRVYRAMGTTTRAPHPTSPFWHLIGDRAPGAA